MMEVKTQKGEVDDLDQKKIIVHVCPILMRTVKFENDSCLEQCNDRDDCPVMIEIQRQEEN